MTSFDTDFTMTIGGKAVAGASSFAVLNPATEQPFAQAPDCSPEQLDQAVAAARAAFPAWAATPSSPARAAWPPLTGPALAAVASPGREMTSTSAVRKA